MDQDVVRRRIRVAGGTLIGGFFLIIALIFALWPGPLALTDRVPVALLFGLAGVAFILRIEPELRALRGGR